MDKLREKERPFRPTIVGPCRVQTATDRFGNEAKRAILYLERLRHGWNLSNGTHVINHGPDAATYKLIPPMPKEYGSNVTALLQKYNLYFSAHQATLYVYVPRNGPRPTIPRHPDARICCYSTPTVPLEAEGVNRFDAPHSIRHVVVSGFGRQEVVVLCHDDGYVTAFYTKDIAKYVYCQLSTTSETTTASTATVSREGHGSPEPAPSQDKTPKPFLNENAGGWIRGVAVHQNSQLIAVCTDRSKIIVFAPALSRSKSQAQACDCESCCQGVEDQVRRRARNWQIIVAQSDLAGGISSVSFVDDKYGNAVKVCSTSLTGRVWLADIWKPNQPILHVESYDSPLLKEEADRPFITWCHCSLVLANGYCLTVHSEEEFFGAPLEDLEVEPELQPGSHPTVNFANYIRDLPENPCTLSPNLANNDGGPGNMTDETVTYEWSEDGTEADTVGQSHGAEGNDDDGIDDQKGLKESLDVDRSNDDREIGIGKPAERENGKGRNDEDDDDDADDMLYDSSCSSSEAEDDAYGPQDTFRRCPNIPTYAHDASDRLDMAYMPHNGETFVIPKDRLKLRKFLTGPNHFNMLPQCEEHVSELAKLAKRHRLIRMYQKDCAMHPLYRNPDPKRLPEHGVVFPEVLTMHYTHDQRLEDLESHFLVSDKMDKVVQIPELFLLVIRSGLGRVMLFTPTRLARPIKKPTGVLRYGLRLEWVLPRRSDEAVHRTNMRPLHGMAVGPVPEAGVTGRREGRQQAALTPKRYRVMLHYRNHDILTYEITREEETGKICIF
ncbi:hypothetical protein E4U39_001542 [Claviceps sp. Clav50 group G5]|nr:hypothetical protein E4U39_001542 [Claviceps sp. Clav50 group G5]